MAPARPSAMYQSKPMAYVQKAKYSEFNLWRKSPLLTELTIELTERCNNSCIHCCINQSEVDETVRVREMDAALVKDILSQAADLGCLSIHFTGGEPCLREDFAELYIFTRRLGMQVTLFTNATRITTELSELMARIPPGKPVEVTVYGMHAETYDAVAARRGAFAEFCRGITLLQEHKIPFIVKQALLPPNRHEIDEFEAWAAALPGMQRKPGYSMNFDLRAWRDNPAKNRLIQSLRLSPDETVLMLTRRSDYVKGMREFCSRFIGPPGDRLFNCGAGHGACIDAYGQAQMCMGLRHPDMMCDLCSCNSEDGDGNSPCAMR